MFVLILNRTLPLKLHTNEGNLITLLGYTESEFIGQSKWVSMLVHAEDQHLLENLVTQTERPNTPFHLRLRHANQQIQIYKVSVQEQDTDTVMLSLQNVKTLFKPEHPNLTDHPDFQAIMDTTNEDLICFKDCNHVYTAASQALASIAAPHLTWTDLIGLTDYDIFPERLADQEYQLEQTIFSTQRVANKRLSFEQKGENIWLDVRKYPITDSENQLTGVFGIAFNITERIKVKQALAFEKNHLRTLLNSISDLIWFKDLQGHFQSCNPAFESFMSVSEVELIGKTDHDLLPDLIADVLNKYDQITLKTHRPTKHEIWIPQPTGQQETLLSITHTTLLDADGTAYGILGVAHDITQHWEDEQNLAESQIQLEKAQSVAQIGSWTLEVADDLLCWSPETYRIFGIANGSPISLERFFQCIHPEDIDMVKSTWDAAIRKQTLYEVEHRILVNGKTRWVQETSEFSFDHNGELLRALGTVQDITERKEHYQQLQYLAHFDPLTNLPNRVLLADRLHLAMHQALRRNAQLAVVYLDLDGFKEVNDQYGHEVGDRLLTKVAQRMKHALRDGDTLARMGGDEFVAVLADVQTPQASEVIFDRLLQAAYKPITDGEHTLRVSASLGATYYPQTEEIDADQLLRQADQAMYQAKLAGKNRFHLFDTHKDRLLRNYNADLSSITEALLQDEFVLHYQPKVNMKTGEVIGVEALIRWQHPIQGLLSPIEFLPMIAGHELSIDLGNWVIRTAMQQIESWKSIDIQLPISVNIDALHLESPNFVTHLKTLLEAHPNIDHGDLELEVLESSALDNLTHVTSVIEACRDLGIGFALDDFGTGYSSLIYLKRLPANLIKIDQGFVRDMLEDPEDLAIIQGVLGLSNAFGRNTIAEGVETILHGERLLKLGCLLGQGYGIARPMPADEIEEWLKTWRPDASWG